MQKIKFTLNDGTHADKVNESGTIKAGLTNEEIKQRFFAEDANTIAHKFNELLDELVANGYAVKNGDDYTLREHTSTQGSGTPQEGPAK